MKIQDLTCPNCGAKLTVDTDSEILKCDFCGSDLLPDSDTLKNDTDSPDNTEETCDTEIVTEETSADDSDKSNQPAVPEKTSSSAASLFSDIVEICVTAITVVIICFAFFARNAVVDGESMRETLQDRDSLIVLSFGFKPKTGDIIVCQSENYGYETPLVKRVIATSGQTISIDREKWQVSVDGVVLDELDYVRYLDGVRMNGWAYGETYTVPEGYVFVMGDNRNNSTDSRSTHIGPIDERLVVGKVILRYLPFGKAKVF